MNVDNSTLCIVLTNDEQKTKILELRLCKIPRINET